MFMMDTVRVNAYAKLNLTLDIVGADGKYHLLDSLAATVDMYDRIVVKKRKDNLISVAMHGMGSENIPPEKNNAQRAGEAFAAAYGTRGADIAVYKNIPVGAGLGGSSADAAGVLNALKQLYGTDETDVTLKQIADGLGSDTGYLLTGGFARLRGRGEEITFLPPLPKLYFLVICPESGVSTEECYKKYDTCGQKYDAVTEKTLELLQNGNTAAAAKYFSNHLSSAAAELNRDAETALREAESFSPLGASITGSGSAAFALFETKELCLWAKSRYRGKFRIFCVNTVNPAKKDNNNFWHNPFALSPEENQ